MDKLAAVNLILRKNGIPPVSSLDTAGRLSREAEAERCLDEEELRIQTEGWHYNTRLDVELTPDSSTTRIALPTGTITIDSDTQDIARNVTQVGGFLYDVDNNTDLFTASLRCQYILRYDFDCIPEPVAAYIAVCAAKTFFENVPVAMRDYMRLRTITEDLKRAMGVARKFNGDAKNVNMFNTDEARAMLGNHTARNATLGGGTPL